MGWLLVAVVATLLVMYTHRAAAGLLKQLNYSQVLISPLTTLLSISLHVGNKVVALIQRLNDTQSTFEYSPFSVDRQHRVSIKT